MCTSDLFSEDGMIGLLEQAVMLLKEVHVYIVWYKTGSRKLFWIWQFVTSLSKFYMPTVFILADLLCKVMYFWVAVQKFSTIKVLYYTISGH